MYRLIRNLYILTFITIIIFVSGWAFQHHSTRRSLTVSAEKVANLSAQSLCIEINGWLAERARTIEAAAIFVSNSDWSEEQIVTYLATLLDHNDTFSSIYFGTADNRLFNATGWQPPTGFDLRERPWYKRAAEEGETIFTEAFVNASSDMIIVTVARPVYSTGGEMVGVVGGDVSIYQIVNLVNNRANSPGGYAFLFDNNNNLLAYPGLDYNPEAGLVGLDTVFNPAFAAGAEFSSGPVEQTETSEAGYLAYQPVELTDWHLATFIPHSAFMQTATRITNEFITAIVATTLVFLLFVFYHNRYVHRPLLTFEHGIKQIDLQDTLDYRLPLKKNDEFSNLGLTINRLLDKVQDYFEKLEEKELSMKTANRELEEMIRQLTTTEEALDYSEEKLYFLSYHDQLTGLYNRSYFEAKLGMLNGNPTHPTTVIFVDIDGLKLINDTMGHASGDRLLKVCAALIRETLQETGIPARVGGDEFAIILPLTGRREGDGIARQLRTQTELYNRQNSNLPLSVSIGVASSDEEGGTLFALTRQAEDLMFRDKLRRSSSARNGLVRSLLAALDERSFSTDLVLDRQVDLCLMIGEKINLSSSRLSNLALLAQVHNLGIVGIPDKILFKKEPLDHEEIKIMQKHPEIGFRIASSSSDLTGVADLILRHHERWDGSGYPLGLRGIEIPIECRILAIVDTYYAMTSNRPYRKAISPIKTLEEILKASGTKFDPEIVQVFIAIHAAKKIS